MGFSEIVPGLCMGSKPPMDVDLHFDTIVLCAAEYQPDAERFRPARVLHAPLWDSMLTPEETNIAVCTGRRVARRFRTGQRILVTCAMGLNRSGLVTALALIDLGSTPDQAIVLVRKSRGALSLRNQDFVRLLHSQPYDGGPLERAR